MQGCGTWAQDMIIEVIGVVFIGLWFYEISLRQRNQSQRGAVTWRRGSDWHVQQLRIWYTVGGQ